MTQTMRRKRIVNPLKVVDPVIPEIKADPVISPAAKNEEKGSTADSSIDLLEIAKMPFKFDEFATMMETEFNFKLKRVVPHKENIEWDMRISWASPEARLNERRLGQPKATLSFGKYFTQNRSQYTSVIVGGGTIVDTPVLVAIFDATSPNLRTSEDNIQIRLSKTHLTMNDVISVPLCRTIIEFFNIKPPIKPNEKKDYFFKVHQMNIKDQPKHGHFIIEHFHPNPKTVEA